MTTQNSEQQNTVAEAPVKGVGTGELVRRGNHGPFVVGEIVRYVNHVMGYEIRKLTITRLENGYVLPGRFTTKPRR